MDLLGECFPFIEKTNTFQSKARSKTFNIRERILNCNSNLVVYLIECKLCYKQYLGCTITLFCSRFSDYKGGAIKLWGTAKNTVMSPNFSMWEFCGKEQFPHSFRRITRNYAETVPFHKISITGSLVKYGIFRSEW